MKQHWQKQRPPSNDVSVCYSRRVAQPDVSDSLLLTHLAGLDAGPGRLASLEHREHEPVDVELEHSMT